jgi:hypothetical protein
MPGWNTRMGDPIVQLIFAAYITAVLISIWKAFR